MRDLTPTESQALLVCAKAINADPSHLRALIEFESGWNPAARNPISGARGLIQFMNTTARGLCYDNADQLVMLNPTSEAQLCGPIIRHFRSIALDHTTFQKLCMAVFYPAARTWDPETEFPAIVQKQNQGIRTVKDYLAKVRRRAEA